ncbi:MAG TPA: hypothetical protein VFH54_06405 [Mycobacteriales bacterium]|nr:hypothetical protein [Mycobacteriales bacterium]
MTKRTNRLTLASATVAGVATILMTAVTPAQAANGPAPGTGLTGGCNMLLDPTMFTVPMANAALQGFNGMFRGVAASGDPRCS